MVFRPFKGEVMFGRITEANETGITRMCFSSSFKSKVTNTHSVRTDFFEDVFVSFKELPENTL